jgi:hypothetical protein
VHFLYKWEWNWNSVNQNFLWCSAGTIKQEILQENSNKWEDNRNFNVLLFVPFKCAFADFLFFVSKPVIQTVHFWHIWLYCDHGPYLMSYLDKWKSSSFHPQCLFLCMERTGSSMELVNSCVSPTAGFGLRFHILLGLGNWTGTVFGNRLFTVWHLSQALTPWAILVHVFNLLPPPHVL